MRGSDLKSASLSALQSKRSNNGQELFCPMKERGLITQGKMEVTLMPKKSSTIAGTSSVCQLSDSSLFRRLCGLKRQEPARTSGGGTDTANGAFERLINVRGASQTSGTAILRLEVLIGHRAAYSRRPSKAAIGLMSGREPAKTPMQSRCRGMSLMPLEPPCWLPR